MATADFTHAVKPEQTKEFKPGQTLFALACFSLVFAFLPLTLSTGRNLEYEYSVLTSFLFLLLPSLVLIFFPKRWDRVLQQFTLPNKKTLWFLQALLIPIAASLLPYLLLYSTGLCLCAWRDSLFWWSVQTLPSIPLGLALTLGCLDLRRRRVQKLRWFALFALLLILLSLLNNLWFAPQKRLIHPLLGFVHGPIYDGWIPVDTGVVALRGAHFLFGLTFFWFFALKRRLILLIGLPLSLGLSLYASTYPSTENGFKALEQRFVAMPGKNFVLHFQRDSKGQVPNSVARIFRETSFHIEELTALMQRPQTKPVHIFVYPDRSAKKLWFGGGTTDVTDVVTPSIHITADIWPHPTLRHELVHALASSFGFNGLGFHPNMAFTEGLAVALAPEDDAVSLDEGSASLLASGRIKDLSALFSPLFWREAGARSYTVAGSFIRFLNDTYGLPSVLRAYAGASWQDATGHDIDALAKAWRERVTTNFDAEKFRLTTESLYRYPGILHDICPHSQALFSRAPNKDDLWLNLRRGENWDPVKDLKEWQDRLRPHNRGAQAKQLLTKGRALLQRQGVSTPQNNRPTSDQWSAYAAELDAFLTTKLYQTLEDVELGIMAADIALEHKGPDACHAILSDMATFASKHHIGPGFERQVFTRRFFIEAARNTPPEAMTNLAWYRYVGGYGPIPELPSMLDGNAALWLKVYLHLRRDTGMVLRKLQKDTVLHQPVPEGFPPNFGFEYFRIIAEHAEANMDFETAATAYRYTWPYALSGQIDLYRQETRKNQWLASTSLTLPK